MLYPQSYLHYQEEVPDLEDDGEMDKMLYESGESLEREVFSPPEEASDDEEQEDDDVQDSEAAETVDPYDEPENCVKKNSAKSVLMSHSFESAPSTGKSVTFSSRTTPEHNTDRLIRATERLLSNNNSGDVPSNGSSTELLGKISLASPTAASGSSSKKRGGGISFAGNVDVKVSREIKKNRPPTPGCATTREEKRKAERKARIAACVPLNGKQMAKELPSLTAHGIVKKNWKVQVAVSKR
jgi:hypothetical protein